MPYPFTRFIIKRLMSDLKPRSGKASDVYRISVVLRCYFYTPCRQVLHRMVGSAMAELQFESPCPACQGNKLMPQAYAKYAYLP